MTQYESLRAADPAAVWVVQVHVQCATMHSIDETHARTARHALQGWQFLHKAWPEKHIADYFSLIPPNRLLVLDLMAEKAPYWRQSRSFAHRPFVWNIMHNFGGE